MSMENIDKFDEITGMMQELEHNALLIFNETDGLDTAETWQLELHEEYLVKWDKLKVQRDILKAKLQNEQG